jgi:hypothetical protein
MTSVALSLLFVISTTSQVRYYVPPTNPYPANQPRYTYPQPYTTYYHNTDPANLAFVSVAGNIKKGEVEDHAEAYQRLWGEDLITRFADLPLNGKVPEWREPYSGYDYPDRAGGTLAAMAKYDYAFHGGHSRAYKHEREDLAFHMTVRKGGREVVHRGPFGRIIAVTRDPGTVPTWYGHCNGWTAAAIRHPEPQKAVVRNGITFTPADIKGMLAELYMYSQTQFLGGEDEAINPAVFHIALTNWVGRQEHPIGMETAVGDPVINFPIFAYRCAARPIAANRYDVRTIVTYTVHLPQEYNKAPKSTRELYFHYLLDLDRNGKIIGGSYFGDSGRIDIVWTPLQPTQGGTEGNESGNPFLNVKEVLAIHRESVDPELLAKWVNVDPTDEERQLMKKSMPAGQVEPSDNDPGRDPAAAPAVSDPVSTDQPDPATTAATEPPTTDAADEAATDPATVAADEPASESPADSDPAEAEATTEEPAVD